MKALTITLNKKNGLISLAMLVLLATTFLAARAYGAIPSATKIISACYDKHGKLSVIDAEAGQSCGANETALNWNQVGPQGPAGSSSSLAYVGSVDVQQDDVVGKTVIDIPNLGEFRCVADPTENIPMILFTNKSGQPVYMGVYDHTLVEPGATAAFFSNNDIFYVGDSMSARQYEVRMNRVRGWGSDGLPNGTWTARINVRA